MFKRWCSILIFHLLGIVAFAQVNPKDSALKKTEPPIIDSTLDYSDIGFDELDRFLDSILSPHSYLLTALSIQRGYFNYKNKTEVFLEPTRKLAFTPAVGYYHKNGMGITSTASFVSDQDAFRFYQLALTPSYDYLDNKNLATGISYSRYFTKDS